MSKWIKFIRQIMPEGRKTKKFKVFTKEDGIVLGEIKWLGSWRTYGFYPMVDTVYEKTCLRDIADFCEKLMGERLKEDK